MDKINFIPKNFDESFFHKNIIEKLKNFNASNILNMILYGKRNAGKKTLINLLLNNIYNTDVIKQSRIENTDIKISNNTINVEYIVSPYHYEINLFEYGFYDKNVITDFIYKLLEYENIHIGLFKIIILKNFDLLSESAQLCLRRIIEKTITVGRFICTANNINKIHDSLLSRFTCIRVPIPISLLCKQYIKLNLRKKSINYTELQIKEIIDISKNDLYKINIILEYINYNKFIDKDSLHLDILNIDNLIKLIKKPDLQSIYLIRDIVYKLLLVNINSLELIDIINKHFLNLNISLPYKLEIINLSAIAHYKAKKIEYNIIVFEWYILSLKKILYNIRNHEI